MNMVATQERATMRTAATLESVEAVRSKPAKRFYAPELDALRFVAFMMVFLRHVATNFGIAQKRAELSTAPVTAVAVTATHAAQQVTPKFVGVQELVQSFDFGVCLFFFLSSFLITRLLLRERETTGTIAVRNFYIRRSLRIWPLYFAFIVLVLIASQFLPNLAVSWSRVLVSLFFVANWAAVLHGWASLSIQPLWSVSVEEQFYLVWPLLARFGRRAIVVLSTVLTLVAFCTLFYLGQRHGTEVTEIWPNTLVQCLFFAGGALTAVFSKPEERRMGAAQRLGIVLLGLVCWATASAVCHIVRFESPGSLDLLIGFALVLLGTFLIFTGVAGWNQRPIPKALIHLGRISYGLYMFHVACLMATENVGPAIWKMLHVNHPSLTAIVGLNSVIGLAVTAACAMLSYKFLELPFLRLKDRFTVVPSRPD